MTHPIPNAQIRGMKAAPFSQFVNATTTGANGCNTLTTTKPTSAQRKWIDRHFTTFGRLHVSIYLAQRAQDYGSWAHSLPRNNSLAHRNTVDYAFLNARRKNNMTYKRMFHFELADIRWDYLRTRFLSVCDSETRFPRWENESISSGAQRTWRRRRSSRQSSHQTIRETPKSLVCCNSSIPF